MAPLFPPTKRRGLRALALVLPLLAACGGDLESEPTAVPETGTQQSSVVLGANRHGVVTGGIYHSGAPPLSDATSRSKFFCERRQLNVKWLRNEAELAEAMRISAESFGDSGVVDQALWYDYRNHTDDSGNFGPRNGWNGSTHDPSKWEPWHEFQKLARGLTARTGDSPDACWP